MWWDFNHLESRWFKTTIDNVHLSNDKLLQLAFLGEDHQQFPLEVAVFASCGSTSLLKPPRFTKFRCDTLQGQVTGKCRANLASYGRCTWCNKLLWVKTVCKSCIIVHQFKIITFLINNLWVSLHQLLLKGAQSAWNGTSGYGYHFKGFSTVEY